MEFNIKENLPFTFSINENELLSSIKNFDSQNMQKKIKFFKERLGLVEDGEASKRVAALLLKEING